MHELQVKLIDQPGPELDAAVCRALGWEPVAAIECIACGSIRYAGSCTCIGAGEDRMRWVWPAVSDDGNQMLRVIEAMRERGFRWLAQAGIRGCCSTFDRSDNSLLFKAGASMPHAVALAALAALENNQ